MTARAATKGRRLLLSAAVCVASTALLAPTAANADALPLYIGDPTANEKVASGDFLSLGESNVKEPLSLAAVKRWGNDDMQARYYSPNLGRFMSVDPVGGTVGSSQSWNRYSYVENNPIGMVDPSGQSGITFWIKQVAKGWRKGTRSQAVRAAGENVHNVRVVGDGASKKARGIVKELNKNKGKRPGTKRHDHDGKHWQTKRSSKWGRALCANMHETLTLSEISVEGGG
jgi:RHS repeat-associated protein